MKFRSRLYLASILIAWLIAGCAPPPSPPPAPPTAEPSSPTATSAPAPASPSPNPTASFAPPLGVFLSPPDAAPGLAAELQPLVSTWAEESGLRFQIRETLSENDFAVEDIRWVVALSPVSNLAGLASSAPKTRFLAVGIPNLEAAANLSVILPGTGYSDQQGFMAGYIAAMITPDWRVGVISLAEDAAGAAAREGFITGAIYFCGLCRQESPPYFDYPLFVELNSEASSSQWQSAANILLTKGVETIYIVPGAGDEELLQYLAQADVKLIGGGDEVTGAIADQWVVSLRFDLTQAVQEHWPDFVAGMDGVSIQVPLTLADPNPDLLSQGRQRLAEKILEEVLAGYIETQ